MTMHALRVMLASVDELDSLSLERLQRPASLKTEERVWAALQGYCKMARGAMGGARKADLAAAAAARREAGGARRALALNFKAEKKRLLSDLESRLTLQAARSRKAGKVVKPVAAAGVA